MAVIPFPNLSPQGSNPQFQWGLRTLSARNMSPLNGVATTLERPGSHWAARLPYENLTNPRRARLQTFAASTRGYANRFYMPLYGWTRRGSFPATELLTNNTFASGTTGWTSAGANTLTASDGLLRVTRTAHASTMDVADQSTNPLTVTQYAPYAARSIDHQGNSTLFSSGPQLGSAFGGEEYGKANSIAFGLKTLVSVLPATTAYFGLVDYDQNANMAGDYIEFSYTSLARCALVDNGPNHVLQSQTLQTTWTQTGLSALGVNTAVAPDGTTTMDVLQENSANSGHSIDQSGARTNQADDICSFGYFKRTAGTRNVRLAAGNDLADFGSAVFDLGAGTVGSVTNAGTATNTRAFVAPVGGGAYFCCVVARCTAAATLRCIVNMANGTTVVYTGDGASQIGGWGVGCTVSSVPTRGGVTVASALQSGTLQTGSALYLKGLPASTNGLLLQGDPVEIITNTSSQLVRVRSSLNSDAAGLGYLQFEAPLRISPLDNAAVIVCNPLCRMMLDSPSADWMERAGGFSDLEFAAIEDTYP